MRVLQLTYKPSVGFQKENLNNGMLRCSRYWFFGSLTVVWLKV